MAIIAVVHITVLVPVRGCFLTLISSKSLLAHDSYPFLSLFLDTVTQVDRLTFEVKGYLF